MIEVIHSFGEILVWAALVVLFFCTLMLTKSESLKETIFIGMGLAIFVVGRIGATIFPPQATEVSDSGLVLSSDSSLLVFLLQALASPLGMFLIAIGVFFYIRKPLA